jgi:aminopeptidase N
MHQSHFAVDVSGKDATKRWRTPVTAIVVGTSGTSRAIIQGPDAQSMTLAGCGPVKINAEETGYFRTLYADEAFTALEGAFDMLSANDQLGLINDAYALGASGDASLARFVDLVERTSAEANPVVLSSVAGKLQALADLFEGVEGQRVFHEFAHSWLASAFLPVGWERSRQESENRSILRADLIEALARFDDADVIAEAKERFAAFRRDPESLPADLVGPVLRTVGAGADKETFDALVRLARAATSPREARLYLTAAAGVRDAALAERAASTIFDPETPSQLAPVLFRRLAEAQPRFAWDYYRSHRATIEELLDPLQRLDYPSEIARRSNNAQTADELETFARENLPASARAEVARAAEAIRSAARVRDRRLPDLVKRLKERTRS